MSITGIYKITSPTGKAYIGQSWAIHERWRQHKIEKSYKGPLQKSFTKHGYAAHKFEIVHELPSDVDQAVLDEYEILYIELYKSCNVLLLNVTPGGLGGRGYKHREEDRKKMSELAKARGITHEEIARMHKANKGKKLSEERKNKISKALTGKKFTAERCRNISNSLKGKQVRNSGSFKPGNSPSAKLTPEQVIEIRGKYIQFSYGYVTIGKEYGVDKKTIEDIIKRKTWAHL